MNDIKQQLIDYYDKYAPARNSSERDYWKCTIREHFKDMLFAHNIRNILEIGAGTGQDSEFFQQNGLDVTAVDLSSRSVEYCLKRGINAQLMDFYHLSFDNCAFGALYAFNCLFHVPKIDLDLVLNEIKRVVKPGGFIFIGMPGGENCETFISNQKKPEPRFFSSHQYEDYKTVLGEKFSIVETHSINIKDYQFNWFIVRIG